MEELELKYAINIMQKFDDLVEFASFLINKSYDDMEISLEDVQGKAIELGILQESKYTNEDGEETVRYFFAEWFEEHRREQTDPHDLP